jgi:hypothetical protein
VHYKTCIAQSTVVRVTANTLVKWPFLQFSKGQIGRSAIQQKCVDWILLKRKTFKLSSCTRICSLQTFCRRRVWTRTVATVFKTNIDYSAMKRLEYNWKGKRCQVIALHTVHSSFNCGICTMDWHKKTRQVKTADYTRAPNIQYLTAWSTFKTPLKI